MTYLIDTNAWIAFFDDSPILTEKSASLMESSDSVCLVSIASLWEASIKIGLGKLKLPYDIGRDLPRILEENGFKVIPIEIEDIASVQNLEPVHRDPFDRIQVAQARRRGLSVVSRDPVFEAYHLQRIW